MMLSEMSKIDMVWGMVLLFLLGSSIFSFLNVVIYRVPRKMDIVKTPSRCEECGHILSLLEMLPVLGWILLRGKCRYCKAKISIRYPAVEALGGSVALRCVYKWGISWQALIVYAFLAVLTMVAFVDVDRMKIPNSFLVVAGVIGVLSMPFFTEISFMERIIGVCCVSVPLLVLALILWGGLGGGDIKLMAVCGLFLGWEQSLLAFVAAGVAAGLFCILMLMTGRMGRKSKVAFGAFLCLGMALVLLI